MNGYTFKRVDEGCYKDLEQLHRETFMEEPVKDYYKDKMNTSFIGVKHLGFIAYTADGQPAGFNGLYPCMMEYKGKSYLAAQSGDIMVHPVYGKSLTLFYDLGKMTYELAKNNGIQFVFGFPNQNAYLSFIKKLKWTHKENMSNYHFNVRTLPLAAVAKKFAFLLPAYRLYAALILKFYSTELKQMPSSAINSSYGGVGRSKEYFEYKSFYNNKLVRLGDRTVWIKIDGALLIGDIEVKADNNIAGVVGKLKQLAFVLGCHKIFLSFGKDTIWDNQLKEKYSNEEKNPVGYLNIQSGLPLDNFKYVLGDFDTF